MINWNRYNNQVSAIIRDAGALGELLSDLGCAPRCRSGDEFRFPCPVHGGDDRNCVVRADGDTVPINWKCYSGKCHNDFKPSLLGLVRGILTRQEFGPWSGNDNNKKVPLSHAAKFLDKFVADRVSSPPRNIPIAKPPRKSWSREQVRARLEIPSPYFLSLGFSREVLDELDVGHSPKLRCSVIPLYDDNGSRCIGCLKRRENNNTSGPGRWSVSEGFAKAKYLYGFADMARSSLPYVVLVEGVKEVFRLREANIPAVACLGSDLSETQAKKLVGLRREVLIAFDNDQAGRDGGGDARKLLLKFGGLVRVLTVPAGHKDLAEMTADEVASWFRANMPR
jgi:hypothetical protein